jgi:hypothetical protein
MHYLRAEAVRWVDLEWPGWVEVQFRKWDGEVVSLVDKAPIFDAGGHLVPGSVLPAEAEISCEVLEQAADRVGNQSWLVRLGYDVEDQSGRRTFNVDEHTLISRG